MRVWMTSPTHNLNCLNCGARMHGAYCHNCGQKVKALTPAVRDFLREAIHVSLHLDGKILNTVKVLVTEPGQISKDFVEGRRVRYIAPLRLYLTFSVLFFLVAALVPNGFFRRRQPFYFAHLLLGALSHLYISSVHVVCAFERRRPGRKAHRNGCLGADDDPVPLQGFEALLR